MRSLLRSWQRIWSACNRVLDLAFLNRRQRRGYQYRARLKKRRFRRCPVETLQPRMMLDANPLVALAVTTPATEEGSLTPAQVTVSRSGDLSQSIDVNIGVDGAASSADYANFTLPVHFGVDEAEKTISISAFDERITEADETVHFTLQSGTGYDIDSAHDEATVTIEDAGNTAPVLTPSAADPTLTAIDEDVDPAGNAGTLVKDLIDPTTYPGYVADVDVDVLGLAITGTDTTNGAWEYSLNGGSTWASLGSPNDSSAVLLDADADTRVRFLPTADYHGTATLTFRAWDRTDGNSNGTAGVDVTSYGASSAYSAGSDTAAISVNSVNDAPTLVPDMLTLPSIDEDIAAGSNTGTLVSNLLFPYSGVTTSAGDIDGDSLGVAIIGADTTHGVWEFTTDGYSWSGLGSPSNSAAVLLYSDATTRVRFTPNADFHGTATITFAAWDRTDGHFNGAQGVSVASPGGASAYSIDNSIATITVNSVNDAPVAVDGSYTISVHHYATTYTGSLGGGSASDVDGDAVTISYPTPIAVTPGTSMWVAFTASDGSLSSSGNIWLTVDVDADVAPTAGDASITVTEDTPFTFTPSLGDTDGDTLTVSIVPGNGYSEQFLGTAVANYDGSITYTPNSDAVGSDSFRYQVSDGWGGIVTATVTVTINNVNDAPVAIDGSHTISVNHYTSTYYGPLGGGSGTDVDGDAVTISYPTPIAVTPGTSMWVAFTASDGSLSSSGNIWLTVDVDPNNVPTAAGDSLAMDENQSLTFDPWVHSFDADGDTLTVSSSSPYVYVNWDGSLTYTPPTNFVGTDAFTYTVSDAWGGSATATVYVTINSTNHAPWANNASYSYTFPHSWNGSIDPPAPSWDLYGDSDGDSLSVSASYSYDGGNSWYYTVTDPSGASATGLLYVSWSYEANNDPVAGGSSISTDEEQSTLFYPLAYVSDPDGDGLTVTSVSGSALLNGDGSVTYTPPVDFQGTDAFTYTVSDGWGGSATATVYVTVNAVNDAPTIYPYASPTLTTIDEDTASASNTGTLVRDLVNASSVADVDGDLLGLAIIGADTMYGNWEYSLDGGSNWTSLGSPSDYGATLLYADDYSRVRFSPSADYNGTATITYRAWDRTGYANGTTAVYAASNGGSTPFSADSDTATITINSVNDAPVAVDGSYTISVNHNAVSYTGPLGGGSGTDVDGDAVTISYPNSISVTPGTTTSFAFTATDSAGASTTGNISLTVDVDPDVAPTASDITIDVTEDVPLTFNPLSYASDTDGDTLTVTSVSGAAVLNSDGTITYTPGLNSNAPDSFQYTVSDGYGGTATANVNVNITPVNDAPTLAPSLADPTLTAIDEDVSSASNPGTLVKDLLTASGYAADADGDLLGIAITGTDTMHGDWEYSYGGSGWTSLGAPSDSSAVLLYADDYSRVRFVPNADYNGSATVTYRLWDRTGYANGTTNAPAYGNGGTYPFSTDSDTATITVNSVNDAPVAVDGSYTISVNHNAVSYTGPLGGGSGTDVDGDAVTISYPNSISVTPGTTTSFAFTATDSAGASTTGNISLTVDVDPDVAPTINPYASPTLTTIDEDIPSASNMGTLVRDLADASSAADADGDLLGLAIVGADTMHGSWEYSLDGGSSWTSLGSPSDSSAVLLYADDNSRLRFTPNADYYGTATVTYRAWDRTSYANGTTAVYAASNGGSTPFSADSGTPSITVTPVNDAPTLAPYDADPVLASTDQYVSTWSNSGTLARDLLTTPGYASDIDGDQLGVAIIAADTANGVWEFTTDGSTWNSLGSPSDYSATLLYADDYTRLRFMPSGSFYGTATISYRAWDRTGGYANGSTGSPGYGAGGTSPFSTDVDTATITVNQINHAPWANGGTDYLTVPHGWNGVIDPPSVGTDLYGDPEGYDGLSVSTPYSYDGGNNWYFTVTDPYGETAGGVITVSWSYETNNAPTAGGDWISTDEDQGTVFYPLSYASDPDGDSLTVTSVSGSVSINWDNSITYTPSADFNGGDSFTYTVSDGWGGSATATVYVTVNAINDAPTIYPYAAASVLASTDQYVSTGSNSGTLVRDLIDPSTYPGYVADIDGDALGVAITGADTSYGSWEYSVNGGGSWTNLGAPSDYSATLLYADDSTRIRFMPSGSFYGTATISYRAWDRTGGYANGGTAAPAYGTGGTTPFSTDVDSATITVNQVNHAPWANNGTYYLTVPHTWSGVIDPPSVGTDLYGDPEGYDGLSVSTPYSYDGGNNWYYTVTDPYGETATGIISVSWSYETNNVPTAADAWLSIDEDQPLLFDYLGYATDLDGDPLTVDWATSGPGTITYTPPVNFSGDTFFTYTVSDGWGGMSTGTVHVTVNAVNDAPTLNSSSTPTLMTIDEDLAATANVGTLVRDLIDASGFGDVDGDAPGIAIIGADETNGTWEFANHGSNWESLSAPSDSAAVLLFADTVSRIRFLPNADYYGTATITFRAWDSTVYADGTFVSTLVNGGTSPFSAEYDTAGITVDPVNDAPTLSSLVADPTVSSIDEDVPSANNTGTLVRDLITASGYAADVDGDALGLAITGSDASHGAWESSLNGGASWTSLGSLSDTSAMLLYADDTTRLRFVPDADFNGTATVTYRTWDRTGDYGNGAQNIDATIGGGSTPFSADYDTATITVNPVNDAPILDSSVAAPTLTAIDEDIDSASNVGTLVKDLIDPAMYSGYIGDVDTDYLGMAITGIDITNGSWEYATDGSTWTGFGSPSDFSAVLLSADETTRIRFLPNADYYGTAVITFRAWDHSDGIANGTTGVDASASGGNSAFSAESGTAAITVNAEGDAPPTLAVTHGPINETDGTVTFTLTLSSAAPLESSVAWNTADRTARAGSDYVAASGTVTFAVGETVKQIVVVLTDDELDEYDESFVLELSDPIGLELITDDVEAVIIDDDPLPALSVGAASADESDGFIEFTITLSAASERVVFVDWSTQDGTAGAGDYRATTGRVAFAPGETSRTIVVQLIDDDIYESAQTFQVLLTDPINATISGLATAVGTITSDDPLPQVRVLSGEVDEATGAAIVRFTLSRPSDDPVTIDWSIGDGADDFEFLGATAGNLTFAAGQTETFVTMAFEPEDEPGDRSFRVDVATTAGAELAANSSGTITVVDEENDINLIADDLPSDPDQPIFESQGILEYKVRLSSASTEVVTVDWQTIDGHAVSNQDYTLVKPSVVNGQVVAGQYDPLGPSDRTLTFAAGTTEMTIYIKLIDNDTIEGDRSFQLKLSNATHAVVPANAATITISDDDIPVYMQDAGVTSANYASIIPSLIPAPPPPTQAPPASLPTLTAPDRSYTIDSQAAATVAAQEAAGLLAGLSDEERELIHVKAFGGLTQNHYGSLYIGSDGSFTFTPGYSESPSTEKTDTFTYELIRDEDGAHATGTITLTIRPPNPPAPTIISAPSDLVERKSQDFTIGLGASATGPQRIVLGAVPQAGSDRALFEYTTFDPQSGTYTYSGSINPDGVLHAHFKAIDDRAGGLGPVGPITVTAYAEAWDDFWGTSSRTTFNVTISNDEPKITNLTVSKSSVLEGETFIISGKLEDGGADAHNLHLAYQDWSYDFGFLHPVSMLDPGYWDAARFDADGTFQIRLNAGDNRNGGNIQLTYIDDDGGSDEASIGVAIQNIPPFINRQLTKDDAENPTAWILNYGYDDIDQETEDAHYVIEYTINGLDPEILGRSILPGDEVRYKVTDPEGASSEDTFTVPPIDEDPPPGPTYNFPPTPSLAPLPPTPPADPGTDATISIFSQDVIRNGSGQWGVTITATGGTDNNSYQVTYEVRKAIGNALIETGTKVVDLSTSGRDAWVWESAAGYWDTEYVATITKVEKITTNNGMSYPYYGSTYTNRPDLIDLEKNTAQVLIHGSKAPESIEIDVSQASQRNLEATAVADAGDVSLGIKEGEVLLDFDPTGLAFSPTYIGNEQQYPIAVVETKLPITASPTSITARLTIHGTDGDIVGDPVTFDVPGTITSSDVLHFAVPLVGKDLDKLPTGRYSFSVTFGVDESGTARKLTQDGEFDWVNRIDATVGDAEFGQGWSIPDTSKLVFSDSSSPGVMLVNGDGSTEWFGVEVGLTVSTPHPSVDDSNNFTKNPHYLPYNYGYSTLVGNSDGELIWSFSGLSPDKSYLLSADWYTSAPEYTTEAKYEVLEGRQLLAGADPDTTFIADQKNSSNINFGLFTPDADGVIRIRLSHNTSSGETVPGALAAGRVLVREVSLDNSGPAELKRDDNPAVIDGGFRLQFQGNDGTIRQYDLEGRIRKITDIDGNRTIFDYYTTGDSKGLLETITTQGGLKTTFEYENGVLDKITDPTGREAGYTITDGQLKKIEAPDPGNGSQRPVTSFDYSDDGLLKSITRENKTVDGTEIDSTTTLGYDSRTHRVDSVTSGDGQNTLTWSFSSMATANFEVADERTSTTNGHAVVLKPATGLIGLQDGNVDSRREAQAVFIDSMDSKWVYQTDRLGFLTALAKPKVYKVDDSGLGFQTPNVDPQNTPLLKDEVWTWVRDYQGRVTESDEPITEDDVDGTRVTYYTYDGIRTSMIQIVDFITGEVAEEEWVYDEVKTDTDHDGIGDWVTSYRLKEHKELEVWSDTPVTRKTTTYENLDAQGRYTQARSSDGSIVTIQYTYKPKTIDDLAGGLIDLTWDAIHGTTDYIYYDGTGPLSDEERREIGLVQKIVYAQGTSDQAIESFTYDAHRNLDRQTDSTGVVTDYDYDLLDRVAKVTHPASTGETPLTESVVYDGLGDVIRSISSAGYEDPLADSLSPLPGLSGDVRTFHYETRYTYDELGRLRKVKDVERNAITDYGYQNVDGGTIAFIRTPTPGQANGQVLTSMLYDSRGQLTAVVDPSTTLYDFFDRVDFYDERLDFDNPEYIITYQGSPTTFYAYDTLGRTIEEYSSTGNPEEDPFEHNGTKYHYDFLDRVDKVTGPDPDGETGARTFIGVQNLPPSITEYTYASDGTLYRETDRFGKYRQTDHFDTAFFHATVSRDVDGNYMLSIADVADRPIVTFDKKLNATVTMFDRRDRPTSLADATGDVIMIEYIERASQYVSGEQQWYFADLPNGLIVDDRAVTIEKITDGRQLVTWKQYDANGNLVRVVHPDPDGAASTLRSTSDVYRYNADGTVAAKWREYGFTRTPENTTNFSYDSAGRLLTISDADGQLNGYEYDRLDNITIQSETNGLETHFEYNALGWQTSTEQYDNGLSISGTVPTQAYYDGRGEIVGTTDRYGNEMATMYDGLGRIVLQFTSEEGPGDYYNRSKTAYDSEGNIAATRGFDGTITKFTGYDALGHADTKVVETTDSVPDSTTYTFDSNGNVKTVTDVIGTVTEYVYDGLNRVLFERLGNGTTPTQPGVMERAFQYDADGNVTLFIDRDGNKTVYEYDGLNRLIHEASFDTAGEPTYEAGHTYDQAGNLASEYDRTIENGAYTSGSSFVYSGFDLEGRARRVDETYRIGDTYLQTTYNYGYFDSIPPDPDSSSARSGWYMTASRDGELLYVFKHLFDALGREVAVVTEGPGAPALKITYEYTLPGEEANYVRTKTERRYENLAPQGTTPNWLLLLVSTITYEVQGFDLVDTVVHKSANGTTKSSFDYNYNEDRQVTSIVANTTLLNASQSFTYNSAGQLLTANGLPVVYSGGPQSTLQYGDFSRLKNNSVGENENGRRDYLYDAEGNRTQETVVNQYLTKTTSTFGYNHANQLISEVNKDSMNQTIGSTYLYYDLHGNLMGKKYLPQNAGGSDKLEFYTYDASGGRTATFTAVRSSDVPTALFVHPVLTARDFVDADGTLIAIDSRTDNKTYWALADAYGTVYDYAYYNQATSMLGIPRYYNYNALGNSAGLESSSTPAIYKGQLYDPNVNLYSTTAGGWYDPAIGENLRLNSYADSIGHRRERNRPTEPLKWVVDDADSALIRGAVTSTVMWAGIAIVGALAHTNPVTAALFWTVMASAAVGATAINYNQRTVAQGQSSEQALLGATLDTIGIGGIARAYDYDAGTWQKLSLSGSERAEAAGSALVDILGFSGTVRSAVRRVGSAIGGGARRQALTASANEIAAAAGKMEAIGPKSRVYAGLDLIRDQNEQLFHNFKNRKDPDANGFFDVMGDGNEHVVVLGRAKVPLTPYELGSLLVNESDWVGQPIRLMTCLGGYGNNSYAQRLANILGVDVKAAPGFIGTDGSGRHWINGVIENHDGSIAKVDEWVRLDWVVFSPK